jgi:hypothetical protein
MQALWLHTCTHTHTHTLLLDERACLDVCISCMFFLNLENVIVSVHVRTRKMVNYAC